MNLNADYLLGRRFRILLPGRRVPEFTCVGYDSEDGHIRLRVHATDGGRWWIDHAYFRKVHKAGVLVESEGAPFAWNHREVPTAAAMTRTDYARIEHVAMPELLRRLRHSLRRITR